MLKTSKIKRYSPVIGAFLYKIQHPFWYRQQNGKKALKKKLGLQLGLQLGLHSTVF